ncbi:Vps60 [Symbiodinium microadriaticum]|nr:Vps60 [Symbiodinium microadriaticum]CAE7945951.1 Vps60 [Symbiodinium sp. KB8]|mmetsp:Transcript_4679/g.11182  ORF Transcript_4679/g.11182 Transcript_4679/m.11182 type:complete len:211 (+) Transcript_4679:46-678(+)|eukprot:CAMPEP_0181467376 /NCGR_PEP_ID=MMETSP1110-20121109/36948_1 /TAXON_ID=174948 /ORGANISM="Symbiodinium sp., Strain CCMP421" /LENGTH=210 /DNA_ID=CAMNT_0023592203 /DNA_START=45 /DNA_END=677 /DNA_ORIENTATION=-
MGGKASQPEPPKPAPNLQDAASNLDQKIEELGAKIQKADEEARQWVAKQSTDATAKARAMQALKRKKLYEQQRDQLVDTQFNVENLAFQQEQAEITAGTVAAMKKATDQLKNQTQKIGVDQVDKLTDEMADIAAEMKDIQSALAAPSAVGSAAEDEAEKELMALYAQQEDKEAEEAMSILAAGGGGYASTTPAPAVAAKAAPKAATALGS